MNDINSLALRSVTSANQGYMSGFGNGFETEALPGALPIGLYYFTGSILITAPSSSSVSR